MLERGTVISRADGTVHVAIEPSEACATCGACAEGAGGARVLEDVVDALGAAVGDTVEVETPLRARRRAQGLVYVVPVAAIIAGYLAGFLLGTWANVAPDAVGAVLALVGGVAALVSVSRFDRYFRGADDQPRVRAIIARCRDRAPRTGRDVDGVFQQSRRESTRE